ncbi:hypothetical protein CHH61_03930 [Shouchella clausii]|uniref:Uncharacterized protein n=1 Tax=Shouchella clausii TaxID=79880 RepID=A0A268S440_SHOCL|nr:hypothetical protein [Shouchella clausii]PAF27285.1 hypothetical protein CHH61_03930 [Shouchella clausii]
MNHRHTSDEDKDLKIIEHRTITSPAFKGEIDPIDLLKKFDCFIDILHNNPRKNDIQRIIDELTSMEIFTLDYSGEKWWINEPLVLHKYVMERPIKIRINHLFKSRGEWKNKIIKKGRINVSSHVRLPTNLTIPPEVEIKKEMVEIAAFSRSIMGIRNSVETMLEGGAPSIGVFRKTDRIIYMNKLEMWLKDNVIKDNANYDIWPVTDHISTANIYSIVNSDPTFKINT